MEVGDSPECETSGPDADPNADGYCGGIDHNIGGNRRNSRKWILVGRCSGANKRDMSLEVGHSSGANDGAIAHDGVSKERISAAGGEGKDCAVSGVWIIM